MFSSQWRNSKKSCLAAAFNPARSTPSGSDWHFSQKSALAAISSHSTKNPAQRCSSQARATAAAQLELSMSICASSSPWVSAGSNGGPSQVSVSEPRPLSACVTPPTDLEEPSSKGSDHESRMCLADVGGEVQRKGGLRLLRWLRYGDALFRQSRGIWMHSE